MRVFGLPVLRLIAVACLVYLAAVLYRERGMASAGLWLALLVLFALLGTTLLTALRRRRARTEARWESALYEPELRPVALRELSRRVARNDRRTQAKRAEHTRLSVLLAELYDADGAYADAMRTIDAVELGPLSGLSASLVLHTRAVIHLRAGNAATARAALEGREPSGDVELDLRLRLLAAYAQAELGSPALALSEAEDVLRALDLDESVAAEARVVRAVALELLGRREEALVVLTALGRASLLPIMELGQPRARELAKAALSSSQA